MQQAVDSLGVGRKFTQEGYVTPVICQYGDRNLPSAKLKDVVGIENTVTKTFVLCIYIAKTYTVTQRRRYANLGNSPTDTREPHVVLMDAKAHLGEAGRGVIAISITIDCGDMAIHLPTPGKPRTVGFAADIG